MKKIISIALVMLMVIALSTVTFSALGSPEPTTKYNISIGTEGDGTAAADKKGIVEGLVGFVTDYTWGKPQRRRAIRMYLDETLMPQFRLAMSDNSTTIVNAISETLHQEAQVTITEKK